MKIQMLVLEALWAFERVASSPFLSKDEKLRIAKELDDCLPIPIQCPGAHGTLAIVQGILRNPSIITDETHAKDTSGRDGPKGPGAAPAPQAPKNHQTQANPIQEKDRAKKVR